MQSQQKRRRLASILNFNTEGSMLTSFSESLIFLSPWSERDYRGREDEIPGKEVVRVAVLSLSACSYWFVTKTKLSAQSTPSHTAAEPAVRSAVKILVS